ncbi:MAG: hypothetical protein V2G42_03675 [bacterium JZ-2024 1]
MCYTHLVGAYEMVTLRKSGNGGARDRVLMSAGYDPALVTNGDTANAISPFVPVPIRARAQSASTRARTTAILRHPALGDPTASPLATRCGPCCCKACFGESEDPDITEFFFDCQTGAIRVPPPDTIDCCDIKVAVSYCGSGYTTVESFGSTQSPDSPGAPTRSECCSGDPICPSGSGRILC